MNTHLTPRRRLIFAVLMACCGVGVHLLLAIGYRDSELFAQFGLHCLAREWLRRA